MIDTSHQKQSIKANLAITELKAQPDRISSMKKARAIIENHIERKKHEREEFPERFGLKPGPKKSEENERMLAMKKSTSSQTDTESDDVEIVVKQTPGPQHSAVKVM